MLRSPRQTWYLTLLCLNTFGEVTKKYTILRPNVLEAGQDAVGALATLDRVCREAEIKGVEKQESLKGLEELQAESGLGK